MSIQTFSRLLPIFMNTGTFLEYKTYGTTIKILLTCGLVKNAKGQKEGLDMNE
ncbi:4415_t:CDS:2, partial [Funneliformis mosseae]